MALAIFDLDNTLIAGDSDHSWGEFMVEQGLVDGPGYKQQNDQFYADYCAGKLDVIAYQEFALTPLRQYSAAELSKLHQQFMATKIAPLRLPKADQLIAKHREQGDSLLIITATNAFITRPIGLALGITELLATEGEIIAGRYTGKVDGIPCYQHGKVQRLQQWLQQTGQQLDGSYFYSDSHNDLPLLQLVSHPVAVDPDETLRDYASSHGWPIISLR